jgi:hypothetical protein
MSHCINLISCDIVQHSFAEKLLRKINILSSFFRNNAMAGMNIFFNLRNFINFN